MICGILLAAALTATRGAELSFADYNDQGFFNNFSGDSGVFANGRASITISFDSQVFHGSHGAALKVHYSVPGQFCGIWNSLLGRDSFPSYNLNFTNLYAPLLNSAGNPSRVERVRVTGFSFWARGNGKGAFHHQVRVELKGVQGLVDSKTFNISNATNWVRYDFPIVETNGDFSRMKELVFVIEAAPNQGRTGSFFIDDLAFSTDEAACDPASLSNDAMLDLISQRAFFYFLKFTDDRGFALDRSTFSDMVSVGTIGFQLAAYCIGAERHWADRAEMERRVVGILENLANLPMGPEPGLSRSGYRGFYYHFLAANLGTRKDRGVELSLYDTALLMYGVLSCRACFANNAQIQRLSRQLFDRVQWDWFVDRSRGRNKNQFFLSWEPGPGGGTFFNHVDGQTDEALMTDILALGSKTHPISMATYLARNRPCGVYAAAGKTPIMVSWAGSLFNYFFADCWLDLKARGIDLDPVGARDLWKNDQLAIEANRKFCLEHAAGAPDGPEGRYATYSDSIWGLTACDNLVGPNANVPNEYFAFGALPSEQNLRFKTKPLQAGTIAVYGAAGSINFVPEASLRALRRYLRIPGLWSPLFGFADGFNLDPHYLGPAYDTNGNPEVHFAAYLNGPWINHEIMGIDVGPLLLAIENFRSRFIWNLTAKEPDIQAGLQRIFGLGEPARCRARQLGDGRGVRLEWSPVPGASEYAVYRSTNSIVWQLRQPHIRTNDWLDASAPKGHVFYSVKAIR